MVRLIGYCSELASKCIGEAEFAIRDCLLSVLCILDVEDIGVQLPNLLHRAEAEQDSMMQSCRCVLARYSHLLEFRATGEAEGFAPLW